MLVIAQRILKALAAAASAGVAAYGTAVSDGITSEEWITLVLAAVGAGIVVYFVPNKPAAA